MMRLLAASSALLLPLLYADAATMSVSVSPSNVTNDHVNPNWMGCHSDYGFARQGIGFYANMVYNPSFADNEFSTGGKDWVPRITGEKEGSNVGLSSIPTFASKSAMAFTLKGEGIAATVNRGIGRSGFVLEAGQPYTFEMYVFTDSSTLAFAELRDYTTNASLARVEFPIKGTGPAWGANWIKVNATLTPSADTTCVSIPFGSDPAISCGGDAGDAHVCVRCGGELVVGLAEEGTIGVGYVSLMPGAWGLLHAKDGQPLPVLKSAGDVLSTMGITIMRSGGTVSQSMRWKDWRGPAWNRPSSGQIWDSELIAGWGPFEVIDMCAALDIQPIITLAYDTNDPGDWADLVEYCHGDPETTSWGNRRALDGHPEVYNVTVFELGNEQYNPYFVEQVEAMEARAIAIGAPKLHYMFPTNGGINAVDAKRFMDKGLPVERVMPDLHVGAGGGVEAATFLFAHPPVPGFDQSAVNCETNAGQHDHQRGLEEAADLMDWFNSPTEVTDRLYARTASFCTGASAQFDQWDQGISFFLPNMTWLQPPGYVHKMISETWGEATVSTSVTDGNATDFHVSAQTTDQGKTIFLRFVNLQPEEAQVSIALHGGSGFVGNDLFPVFTLKADDLKLDNTPEQPTRVSPVHSKVKPTSKNQLDLVLPQLAFVVVKATLF